MGEILNGGLQGPVDASEEHDKLEQYQSRELGAPGQK